MPLLEGKRKESHSSTMQDALVLFPQLDPIMRLLLNCALKEDLNTRDGAKNPYIPPIKPINQA